LGKEKGRKTIRKGGRRSENDEKDEFFCQVVFWPYYTTTPKEVGIILKKWGKIKNWKLAAVWGR